MDMYRHMCETHSGPNATLLIRSACDKARGPQKWITANFPGVLPLPQPVMKLKCAVFLARLQDDMETRSLHGLKNRAPQLRLVLVLVTSCKVALYVAGFPCKAFSNLRHRTEWLEDKEARQFYMVRDCVKRVQPPAACLSGAYS